MALHNPELDQEGLQRSAVVGKIRELLVVWSVGLVAGFVVNVTILGNSS
jgi:hypothetical protein